MARTREKRGLGLGLAGPKRLTDTEGQQKLYGEALGLVEGGMSREDVASRFGVGANTVSRWCVLRWARVAAEMAGLAGRRGDGGTDPAGD